MLTTNRLIPVDTIASDPDGLIHLTGLLQMGARVTMGDPDAMPTHVELWFDGAQVRGLGLDTGARYEAGGTYRFKHEAFELSNRLDRVSTFEFVSHDRGNSEPVHRLLVVRFQVTVLADGKITMGMVEPKLLPCP